MEAIIAKMKEYLAMDTEIDFQEFQGYYRELLDFLAKEYQKLGEEELLTINYILNTVAANAEGRAQRKDANMKKFRKITEKCQFWAGAIKLNLTKNFGYDQDKLDAAEQRIDGDLRPQAAE